MPPKLLSEDGRHVVIRPLAYCKEQDIEAYAASRPFPIIPCNLCGSQENLQRKAIKAMLRVWEKQTPGRLDSIFASLRHVAPSHLADTRLFDFLSLGAPTGSRTTGLNWLPGDPKESPSVPAIPIPIYRRPRGGAEALQNEQFDLSSGAW